MKKNIILNHFDLSTIESEFLHENMVKAQHRKKIPYLS